MAKDLTALFSPKSVAIIGASRSPEKVGAIVLKNIITSGFGGMIYPVNPNVDQIDNLPVFKDLASLPQIPDLAVIAIPVPAALDVLTQAGEKGIKNAVIFSAGFKEAGEEGKKLEDRLISIAQQYNINVLGPNCLGFVNNLCPINVTFGEVVTQTGNLRFISQSGALASSLFDWCKTVGLGFSEFITLGNKAVINENDVLSYFQSSKPAADEGSIHAHPIGLYLESISQGAQFLRLTSEITKTDPIFILKPGKTQAAAKAMQSHTGAIAGEDAVMEAVLAQAGVIRCESLEDFFDLSRSLSWKDSPQGDRVAIISNAGGPAVISADAVITEGLKLAEFDTNTHQQLLEVLPRSASVFNPVDVLGDALADRYFKAAEIIFQTDAVDALVVILTPQIMTQIGQTATVLGELSKKYQKLIFCSFIGGSLAAEGEQKLNELKIPSFRFPERAIATIGKMWRFRKHQTESKNRSLDQLPKIPNIDKVQEIISQARQNNEQALNNLEANQIVSAVGISTPPTTVVSDLASAKSIALSFGYPVVLKMSSPGLLHKKKIGGVITDIGNDFQLEVSWNKIKEKIALLDSQAQSSVNIQIQKDITFGIETGVEVIIGVKSDPTFGQVLLFGAGGSYAELLADRNIHLLPLDLSQARQLVEGSKIFPLLSGTNCDQPYTLDKLCSTIVLLGQLAASCGQLGEIEINPVIVTQSNVWAVDNKVILKQMENPSQNKIAFQKATNVSAQILSGKLHYFTFETEKPLIFKPGQYITVKVAPNRINCYSLIATDNPNKFSLLIDTTPGGLGSQYFDKLQVLDQIEFLGPFGTFTLNVDDGAKHLLFLGTGCGMAPLRCQIDAALKQLPGVPLTLYLGLNYPKDVFWKDYFDNLTKNFPNFNYKIAVFHPDTNWTGLTGFITDLLKKDFTDTKDFAAYLCGNPLMVEGAINILNQTGCPNNRIYTERYK